MELNSRQRAYLRSMCNTLPAILFIGKEGVKGCLQAGADADLVVLNEDLDIVHVMAKGVHAADQGTALLKGRFER